MRRYFSILASGQKQTLRPKYIFLVFFIQKKTPKKIKAYAQKSNKYIYLLCHRSPCISSGEIRGLYISPFRLRPCPSLFIVYLVRGYRGGKARQDFGFLGDFYSFHYIYMYMSIYIYWKRRPTKELHKIIRREEGLNSYWICGLRNSDLTYKLLSRWPDIFALATNYFYVFIYIKRWTFQLQQIYIYILGTVPRKLGITRN